MFAQCSAVGIHILDGSTGYTCPHGRLNDGNGNTFEESWVEGFRNNVIRAKFQRLPVIGKCDFFRSLLLCKVDESVGARNLHFVVNGGRAAIEGAAKEEGEAKDVVYLIWEIRSPGTDDGVGPRLAREVRVYLWVGISHRENKWIGRHLLNHLLGYTVTRR